MTTLLRGVSYFEQHIGSNSRLLWKDEKSMKVPLAFAPTFIQSFAGLISSLTMLWGLNRRLWHSSDFSATKCGSLKLGYDRYAHATHWGVECRCQALAHAKCSSVTNSAHLSAAPVRPPFLESGQPMSGVVTPSLPVHTIDHKLSYHPIA